MRSKTYLLKDLNEKIYIGYSNDLKRRIKEPKLIYYEAYQEEENAKTRERKLKHFGSSYKGLLKRLNLE